MFRPFLNSLMLGSLVYPFIAIAGSNAQGGVIYFRGQIVEPTCDVSTLQAPPEMTCMQPCCTLKEQDGVRRRYEIAYSCCAG